MNYAQNWKPCIMKILCGISPLLNSLPGLWFYFSKKIIYFFFTKFHKNNFSIGHIKKKNLEFCQSIVEKKKETSVNDHSKKNHDFCQKFKVRNNELCQSIVEKYCKIRQLVAEFFFMFNKLLGKKIWEFCQTTDFCSKFS